MKKHTLLNSSLTALMMVLPAMADFPAAVVADGPLAYYRFEEDPGATTLVDSSGNGLDIDYTTPLGTTVLGEAAAVGKGALFKADGSLLSPLNLDPSIGDFTIEAVLQADSTVGDGVFVANQDGTLGPGRSNLVVNAARNYTSFAGGATTNSGVTASVDEFDHVIVTYDQSASLEGGAPTFRFYVNGEAAGTSEFVAEAANGDWVIASHKSQASQFFAGILDEVAIYDKRLDDINGDGDESDSRIADHYKEYLGDTATLIGFESSVPYLDGGSSAELSWYVSPSLTSLTIDDGTGPVDVLPSTVDCRGVLSVSPVASTTYTLTGTGPVGTESLEVKITVDEPVVIDSFSTTSENVPVGGTTTLEWEVTNGTAVEIDNGVGPVDAMAGSVEVTVDADTTFTLSATNSQGTQTAQVTVSTFTVDDPTLIAHWKVGESPGELAGSILESETGDMFDGIFVGAPTFDTADPAPVPGGSSASISFDGAGSWVEITNFTGIGGNAARTVAFWFKGDAVQTNNNANLVGWGTGGTTNRFDTRINTAGVGQIRTEVAGSGSNGTKTIADGEWHHCAVVVDPTVGTTIGDIQFYIDGAPDPLTVAGGTEINTTTTNPVLIGYSPGIANRALTGKMDDIRIYDRALSAAEIEALVAPIDIPLQITGIRRLEDGNVELSWSGAPGEYFLEYSRDLTEGSWLEISDSEIIEDGQTSATSIDNVIAPVEGNTRIFYRFRPLD